MFNNKLYRAQVNVLLRHLHTATEDNHINRQDGWCLDEIRNGDVMNTSQKGCCLVCLHCSNVHIAICCYSMYCHILENMLN